MILNIKNLGTLKEAEIDLSKDLILLCGHNNTGKTYVAYAVYHFLSSKISTFFAGAEDFIINSVYDINIDLIEFYKKRKEAMEEDLKETKEGFAMSILQDDYKFNNLEYELSLPKIADLKENIEKRNYISTMMTLEGVIYKVNKNEGILSFNMEGNNDVYKRRTEKSLKSLIEDSQDIQDKINDTMSKILGFKEKENIKIFSSERAAINIFSKELAINKRYTLDEILKAKGAEREKLLKYAEKNINRYQKAIADELEIAEDLLHLSKKKSDFEFLAIELEKSILEGKISVGQYGGLQYQPNFYSEKKENVVLEIYQTSSLVKSLASLVFYLRHLAEKNDCIIIDEPELNLHPDNQILVARFLARLVNESFKVLASTHSDYVIGELSNLLMLNNSFEEKEELMKMYGYNENELLKNEQVGVYYFEKGKNTAVSVPLLKRGIEIDSINEVITDLNERSDNIYYTFLESDANIAQEKEEAKKTEQNIKPN